MVEITFALIRKANPNSNFDELNSISSLNLSNCSISHIDNLEIFEHVKELILSNNSISKIENLFFFKDLEMLDLSCNRITSHNLIESIKEIPSCLKSINLSGNPCADDISSLSKIQDTFPDLGIIIDVMDEDEDEDGEDDELGSSLELKPDSLPLYDQDKPEPVEESDFFEPIDHDLSKPLRSDEILKSLVDRKCKLQSIPAFNLDATVNELNTEYETAIQVEETDRESRRKRLKDKASEGLHYSDDFFSKMAGLKADMIHRNKEEVTKFDEMMMRLKKTTQDKLREIKHGDKTKEDCAGKTDSES